MSLELLRFAAGLYAVATAGYLLYFARPRHTLAARFGGWFLSGAVVVHLAAIGLACKEFGGLEWFTLRGGIVLTAVLLAGTYLLVQRFYHLPSVGAFVTPLTLIILLPTLFGEGGSPGDAPAALRHPAITFHIMTASLGVSLFGLAFGVALMYLLQEREVKGKRFGALFSRLPPLDSLDKLIDRLVRLGFLSFTVASIVGARDRPIGLEERLVVGPAAGLHAADLAALRRHGAGPPPRLARPALCAAHAVRASRC